MKYIEGGFGLVHLPYLYLFYTYSANNRDFTALEYIKIKIKLKSMVSRLKYWSKHKCTEYKPLYYTSLAFCTMNKTPLKAYKYFNIALNLASNENLFLRAFILEHRAKTLHKCED